MPTTRPRRITVMRSATARTSRSLWVMNTMEVPCSRSARITVISSSVSCGVSTAVGSSRMSMRASRLSALMISTRCCTPTGRSATSASGRNGEVVALGDLADLTSRAALVDEAQAAGVLVPEHHVLGHGEHRDQHEVLVHHAHAGGHRVARATEGDRLPVDEDLPLIRLVQAVEDVHQGALAGAVLAEQRVDLARFHGQVDAVVGDERAEAFGDPLKLEPHASPFRKDGNAAPVVVNQRSVAGGRAVPRISWWAGSAR